MKKKKKKEYYMLNFQSKYCYYNQSPVTDLCVYNVMESVATQDTASIVGHFKAAYITWISGTRNHNNVMNSRSPGRYHGTMVHVLS